MKWIKEMFAMLNGEELLLYKFSVYKEWTYQGELELAVALLSKEIIPDG